MGDVIRSISVRLVLAGLLFALGNSPASAHDGNDIEAQAKTHLRLVLAMFSNKAPQPARKRHFKQPNTSFDKIIERASQRYGIRKAFIRAVVRCESNFDPLAVSRKNAKGLMQLVPATASGLGVDPDDLFNPKINIEAGTKYIRFLSDRYDGELKAVTAAYNAGPRRYEEGRRLPAETREYVRCVEKYFHRYSRQEESAR